MVPLIGIVLAILTYFLWVRHYANDDNRLPPFNTPEGKKARIAGVPVLALLLGSIVGMFYSSRHDAVMTHVLVNSLLASSVYTVFILYRKSRHK